MAESDRHVSIECGFCLCKREELTDARELPCTHVHCLQCLSGYFEENNVLTCLVEDCGEIVEGSPDTLPSYNATGENHNCCDVCVSKKLAAQQAAIYCIVCCKKFCGEHQESHDDTMSEHPNISMQDFRTQAMKKQTRNCAKHEDQEYVIGCKLCMSLACLRCLANLDKCDKGGPHSLLSLEDLVAFLMKSDIRAEMMAKEDQYEKLFKEASRAKADYDDKTAEMIELIHQTRDEQVNALQLKYKNMEDELMEKRQMTRLEMTEFMDNIVLKKWTQLRNQGRMLKSRVKHSHQVDVVNGIKELKEAIQKLIEEELPKLELTDELQLKRMDVNRRTELEAVPSDGIVIDSKHGLTTLPLLPQSLTLLKSVDLPANPTSVCHYNGSTYIGLSENNTVVRVDNNYQLHNSFITTSGKVESITVYKDRFYTLIRSNPRTVSVYDASGGHITSWNHPYHISRANMLTIVADQVVIADPKNERITVYSLTGESLCHIPCHLLSLSHVTVCAVDNTSVVISDMGSSKVFRVNITTGEVMWTLFDVKSPQGMACYGNYILLAAHKNKTIYILSTTTGNIVSEMVADAIGDGDWVHGLGVYGTTLVVPKSAGQTALFHHLNVR